MSLRSILAATLAIGFASLSVLVVYLERGLDHARKRLSETKEDTRAEAHINRVALSAAEAALRDAMTKLDVERRARKSAEETLEAFRSAFEGQKVLAEQLQMALTAAEQAKAEAIQRVELDRSRAPAEAAVTREVALEPAARAPATAREAGAESLPERDAVPRPPVEATAPSVPAKPSAGALPAASAAPSQTNPAPSGAISGASTAASQSQVPKPAAPRAKPAMPAQSPPSAKPPPASRQAPDGSWVPGG